MMAKDTTLSLDTTDGLLKALLVLSRTVEHVLEDRTVRTADVELSRSKLQIVRLLGQRGSQTATQIARFLGVSKPAVTQIVDSLVRQRIVVRRRTREDRRGVALLLTDKGRGLFRKIRSEQRHLVRNATRLLGGGDADRWIRLLHDITGALARSDLAFEQYCLQCGAHADGTCVLVGGDANCLFLQDAGRSSRRPVRTRRSAGKPAKRVRRSSNDR